MSEFDRYVKGIQDLLGNMPSPAERLSAMEQAFSRFTGSESRGAAHELTGGLTALPERVAELQKVLSDFGTPATQLRELEGQLAATREQLELSARQLALQEQAVGRAAALLEQLALLQEPFLNAARAWQATTRPAGGSEPGGGRSGAGSSLKT